jgi:hypothetical protein
MFCVLAIGWLRGCPAVAGVTNGVLQFFYGFLMESIRLTRNKVASSFKWTPELFSAILEVLNNMEPKDWPWNKKKRKGENFC